MVVAKVIMLVMYFVFRCFFIFSFIMVVLSFVFDDPQNGLKGCLQNSKWSSIVLFLWVFQGLQVTTCASLSALH